MSYSWYAENTGSKFNAISKDLKAGKLNGLKYFKSDNEAAVGPRAGSKYVGVNDSSGNYVFIYGYPDKTLEIVGFSGSDPTETVMVLAKKYGIEFTDDFGSTTTEYIELDDSVRASKEKKTPGGFSNPMKILGCQASAANKFIRSRGNTIKRGRKTITTTHGRYPVSGLASDATIGLMMMPYEKLVSVNDSKTGKPVKKLRKRKINTRSTPTARPRVKTTTKKYNRIIIRKRLSPELQKISSGVAPVGD